MQSIIALDLETTGLDANRDAIIEVGAVRFKGNRVEEEWQSLINPGRPIPPEIVQLTGITDQMVAGAPRFQQILDELNQFLDDLPVLGHNIRFDLQFLQHKRVARSNPTLDTYDLASVVLPAASQYSLSGLATHLGVPLTAPHRALEDAQTTHQVYCRLMERLLELPGWMIQLIAEQGMQLDWGGAWIFEDALDTILETEMEVEAPDGLLFGEPASPAVRQPLVPAEKKQKLDSEGLAAILEPGGEFAKHPGYEHRTQQVSMLRSVASALSESRLLLVEAGTGTGKSMAYLIPALTWAEINGERVVISTNTINLQDQLIHKDIPELCDLLQKEYRTAILKGRGNYLCPNRLSALMKVGVRSADEMRILAKVLVWLHQGGSGDRSELSLRGPGELRAWSGISSDSADCSIESCSQSGSGICPYYQALSEAEGAHIVVVNHALLLADIATGNQVIPEYQYLIVDEAHHLESATTNGLSFHGTDLEFMRALRDLGTLEKGLIGNILRYAKSNLNPETFPRIQSELQTISASVESCLQLSQSYFDQILEFLDRRRDGQPVGPYGQTERIVPSSRTLHDWNEIELIWDGASDPLGDLIHRLDIVGDDLSQSDDQALEGFGFALRGILRILQENHNFFNEVVFKPDPGMIYWFEIRPARQGITFRAAPLDVGPLIERHLWHAKESVIMTSATMTTMGNFDYLRQRLSAADADELALGSPFDYETSTLLYLIDDIPEPQDRQAYQRAFENGLKRLALATEGKMLVLFTSHQQLARTMQAISSALFAEGILVLAQTGGASRHALLEAFKSTEKAVLLGTRSFWEGVDVPGESLSVLAIARLPFDVPSDPIVAARSETFEFPFEQYSIPEAILRYRQGFGRLIRTKSDRGAVVNFDRRLLSKRYGKAFIDSLPECTLRKGSLAGMPQDVSRWLGQ